MDKNAPDALVMGYESLIPSPNLPDEKDRHVGPREGSGDARSE